ncbi:MAG TPA: host attachment protein [Kofleriaceae bacterium]
MNDPIERVPRADNVCVVVADAARARVLVLESELVDVSEITNPILRARGAPGQSGSGAGRRDIDRHFAAEIAEEAAGVWSLYPGCELILVASPGMLGLLRPAIARKIGPRDRVAVRELAQDLTRLAGPKLHDQLAEAGLIPPRGRQGASQSAPGLPA